MNVVVVPPDPSWLQRFEEEARRLKGALGDVAQDIHHIGSTSIHGIHAKPIIDILLVVRDHAELDAMNSTMEALGYEVMGEFGIAGRRYFRRMTDDGTRTHHIHAFESGSESANGSASGSASGEIQRHLAFRDYMNAHPGPAQEYGDLKKGLAAQFPHDIQGYMDGKDAFIKKHEALALAWHNHRSDHER